MCAEYRSFAIDAFNKAMQRMDVKLHALTLYLDPRYKELLRDGNLEIWNLLRFSVCCA